MRREARTKRCSIAMRTTMKLERGLRESMLGKVITTEQSGRIATSFRGIRRTMMCALGSSTCSFGTIAGRMHVGFSMQHHANILQRCWDYTRDLFMQMVM